MPMVPDHLHDHDHQCPPKMCLRTCNALVEEWCNISQQEPANLVHSLRIRCNVVLKAAGHHTRYGLLLSILTPLSVNELHS